MVISKSEFMLFLKHPAWLWLKKHDKNKIPIPDEALQAKFDEGTLFEAYAEKIFPDAMRLGYKTPAGEFSGTMYYALPDTTASELRKGTRVLLQGRVEIDGLTAIFDVLERVGEQEYNLYEIKSSTSVKPEHISDLAFQTIVLEKAGLIIRDVSVIHVNNEYVRNGEIVPEEIAKKENITEDVRAAIPETEANIEGAKKVIDLRVMPDPSPRYLKSGDLAEWLQVYEAVKGEVPDYSIYNLCTLKPELVGELEDMGIQNIADIPIELEKLTDKQRRQIIATKTDRRKIDTEEIREFLDTLVFPIHFFDYETLSGVIPAFDGTRPYQQVPFQYSLHILKSFDGDLEHKEYLHDNTSNPVPPLLEKMKEHFEGSGSIISWNKKFEAARNNEMAKMYPEYANFLLNINDRMVDLMDPFSKGWFTDKKFFGSASLKYVLPVIAPELSYKELEVSNGGQAQRVWMDTILGGKNPEKKAEILRNLSTYCTLDTYATYVIYRHLEEIVKK